MRLRLAKAHLWASMTALMMVWGWIILPKHSEFHVSFIKTLIPKLSIMLLTLVKF